MVKTLTQIAGEKGLNIDASKNLLDDQTSQVSEALDKQQSILLNNANIYLQNQQSMRDEQNAARGFARSTFTEGADKQVRSGILNQLYSDFAQARTAEASKNADLNRSMLNQAFGSSLTQDINAANTQNQIGLMREQAGLEETSAQAGYGRQLGLLGAQTGAQKDLIGTQTQANIQMQTEANKQELDRQLKIIDAQQKSGEITAEAALARQKQLMSAQTAEQQKLAGTEFGYQSQLSTQQAGQQLTAMERQAQLQYDNSINTLREQQRLGELSADEALQRQFKLTADDTSNKLKIMQDQFDKGEISATTQFERSKAMVQDDYLKKTALIQEQQRLGELSADEALRRQRDLNVQSYEQQKGILDKQLANDQISNAYKTTSEQQLITSRYNEEIRLAERNNQLKLSELDKKAQFDANGNYIQGSGNSLAEQYYWTSKLDSEKLRLQQEIELDKSRGQYKIELMKKLGDTVNEQIKDPVLRNVLGLSTIALWTDATGALR